MLTLLDTFALAPPFSLREQNTGSIEAWIYSTLSADTHVVALASTRIYEDIVPQNASYPAITYSLISEEHGYTLNNTNRQVTNRIQVSCWATSGVVRRQLGDAIADALDGYRGTSNGKVIQSCFIDNVTNVYEASAGNEAQRLYGKHIDFEITHVIETPDRTE